jgi:hypothetical protein
VGVSGKTRQGKFLVKRKSRRDRVKAKLREIKDTLRRKMHLPIQSKDDGLDRSSPAASPTTRCRVTSVRSWRFTTMSPAYGGVRFGGAVKRTA